MCSPCDLDRDDVMHEDDPNKRSKDTSKGIRHTVYIVSVMRVV
jgi:hypothetical protein